MSYRPRELFDEHGCLREELAALAPAGQRRMGANPHANGGALLRPLVLPRFHEYAVAVPAPGRVDAEATRVLGRFLRDVMKDNLAAANFRLFGPDEIASNRLDPVFEATAKQWMDGIEVGDNHLAADGRVMEVLSEHLCEGWLEGYLLTGRHGLFSCYEAFIHIIGSMFNQHAKWLKVCNQIAWRKQIASLNILLTSHVWPIAWRRKPRATRRRCNATSATSPSMATICRRFAIGAGHPGDQRAEQSSNSFGPTHPCALEKRSSWRLMSAQASACRGADRGRKTSITGEPELRTNAM
jgi:D-xylulose 5-phosphate/D-fructose 6-phosphate phosphoketolase/XFP N-terminal domain